MENLEGEIWKPVIFDDFDFTGLYEVSNMGRVKNIVRKKYLKLCINSKGYKQVIFYLCGVAKCFKVHLLVIRCFGTLVAKGCVIDHINSEKTDNRLSNLRVITKRANSSKEKTEKSMLPCGVSMQRKTRIGAKIRMFENKQYFLGIYKTVDSASYAYQLALAAHEKGFELEKVFKVVNDYREIIGLKPIKRQKRGMMA